jgi:hypothetical protein
MRASVLEAERGAGDDVLDRRRHEYLAAGGAGHHACGEMHCDAMQGAGTLDNLAHMHTRTRPDAELFGGRLNALCRPNGRWPVRHPSSCRRRSGTPATKS